MDEGKTRYVLGHCACEHAFAQVNVFDVRENERAVVLACEWVDDVVSERGDSAVNEITSHSMLKALSLTQEAFIYT
jgi:hypothetical protein